MYLLGYDVGSSSIKAALVEAESGKLVELVQAPQREMSISSPQPGWAEQDPEQWWKYLCEATHKLFAQHPKKKKDLQAIGLAYQMHGLVLTDRQGEALRPSIIWCDGRAVELGKAAFQDLGETYCLSHLLNSPGNFTASKLRWVKENEADIYRRAAYAFLPGDYLAMRMTGLASTTLSGLSEGTLWDFPSHEMAHFLMDHYELDEGLLPVILPTFGEQGGLTKKAAAELGLTAGIPLSYRAGDQPNNALSLGVLDAGEVAASGGTSGVVYAVVDRAVYDLKSRVNGFAHVNHSREDPRIGILLCINGTGIQYHWLQKLMNGKLSYPQMEALASGIPTGSGGISVLPFGNGAERMLENKDIGAHQKHINFNRHARAHLIRASLEGIAFAFVYGMQLMKEMGIPIHSLSVSNDNLFQSDIFSNTVSSLMGIDIDLMESSGAIGAAKGAGFGIGLYQSLREAVGEAQALKSIHPRSANALEKAYEKWLESLTNELRNFR